MVGHVAGVSGAGEGHGERRHDQRGVLATGAVPADDPAMAQVPDGGEEQLAFPGRELGDVGHPALVRPLGGEVPPQQVGGAAGVWPAAIPAFALAALGLSTEAWLAPRTGELRWPVRGYVAVITLMALAALTLPAARWPALLGALLFLLSDLLLALELFVLSGKGPKRAAGYALWSAYWSGQALILWGMVPPATP